MFVLKYITDELVTKHKTFSSRDEAHRYFDEADQRVREGSFDAATLYFVPGKDNPHDAIAALSDTKTNNVQLVEIDYEQRLKQLAAKLNFDL